MLLTITRRRHLGRRPFLGALKWAEVAGVHQRYHHRCPRSTSKSSLSKVSTSKTASLKLQLSWLISSLRVRNINNYCKSKNNQHRRVGENRIPKSSARGTDLSQLDRKWAWLALLTIGEVHMTSKSSKLTRIMCQCAVMLPCRETEVCIKS